MMLRSLMERRLASNCGATQLDGLHCQPLEEMGAWRAHLRDQSARKRS